MIEREVKILDIKRHFVEGRLAAMGARKVFEGEVLSVYFDFPDGTLARRGDILRLRKNGEETALTFKRHLPDAETKTREEQEVEVSDFLVLRAILESLGLAPWLEMKKRRTSYEVGDVHVELDKYHDAYDYIPEFMEIEGVHSDAVFHVAESLGFSREDCKPWDALQVADYYSRRREAP